MAKISLSPKEESLFALLLEVLAAHHKKTTLRVAGGWVRDKVLGKQSDDIDIALDDMTGEQFAILVKEHLEKKGVGTSSIGVIQANPEQSKHLETATMRVSDVWVDFVHLRSETYSETSRIPEVLFGTAKEDALRRDLTFNALFYNINEAIIEDFTGRGLADLREGIARTPLPPLQTFLDDPLRTLRSVRFATRFGFRLDDELVEAVKAPEVLDALRAKISKERIGKELKGALGGPRPARALALLYLLKLCDAVFLFPKALFARELSGFAAAPRPVGDVWRDSVLKIQLLLPAQCWFNEASSEGGLAASIPSMTLALAAFFLPHARLHAKLKGKKFELAAEWTCKHALKLSNADSGRVGKLLRGALLLVSGVGGRRSDLGLVLRQLKEDWADAAVLAVMAASEAPKDLPCIADVGEFSSAEDGPTSHSAAPSGAALVEPLLQKIRDLGLDGVWREKPILSGKDLMEKLGLRRGPEMKQYVDEVMRWQLDHPGHENPVEACLDHLQEKFTAAPPMKKKRSE